MKLFKLSIKFFLLIVLIYSIFILGIYLLADREITLNGFVTRNLIFGIVMTLILVPFHKYQVNSTAKEFGLKSPDYDVAQIRVFYSSKSPEQVFKSIEKRSHYGKVSFLEANQIIKIKTGFSGKSWGDRIIINSMKEKEKYKYEVQSKPIFPLTIIDFGQNLENVFMIERYSKMLA